MEVVVDNLDVTELFIRAEDHNRQHLIHGSWHIKEPNVIQPFKLRVPEVISVDSDDEAERGSVIEDHFGLIEIWLCPGHFKKAKGKKRPKGVNRTSDVPYRKTVGPRRITRKLKAIHGHTVTYEPDRPDKAEYEVIHNEDFVPIEREGRLFLIHYNCEDMLEADRVIPSKLARERTEKEGLKAELTALKLELDHIKALENLRAGRDDLRLHPA